MFLKNKIFGSFVLFAIGLPGFFSTADSARCQKIFTSTMEDYTRFGDKYYKGDMQKAYNGSTENFREDKSRILDKEGKIKDKYKGMEGYALFADRYYEGDMFKAYKNISAVLKTRQMRSLGWRQTYWGNTKNFQEDKSRILDKSGDAKNEYKGMEGYALFADRYYEGDMFKAYKNISAVLGGFRQIRGLGLGWQKYEGRTEQFRKD